MPFGDHTDDLYEVRLPQWETGSVWRFRREMTLDDEDRAARLTSVANPTVDWEARDRALAAGEDYRPELTVETRNNAVAAFLYVMSAGWDGPEFLVSSKAKQPDGSAHPLAGKLAPCTLDFIKQMRPTQIDTIRRRLNKLYATGRLDDEDSFPAEPVGASVPESTGRHGRKPSVSAVSTAVELGE